MRFGSFGAAPLSLAFLTLCLGLALSPRSHASAQDVLTRTVVALADYLPERWLTDDADSLPLQPERQRRRMPRRCRTRGGYRRHCAGERLVPTPRGPAAELARRLGLGLRATAMAMMHVAPLEPWLAAVRDLDQERRLTFPVPTGHVGRGFGYTRDTGLRHRRHLGLDIGADEGASIVAARGGLVVYSDNGITGMGNVVILLHSNGDSTLYAHCRATHVFAGQYVRRGEIIAEVGETGFANAPHLHFEWRTRGWPRNPIRRFLPRVREDASERTASL